MVRYLSFWLFLLFLLFPATNGFANEFDHSLWNELVAEYVHIAADGHSSAVDYHSLQKEHGKLQSYLSSTSEVEKEVFDGWSKSEQLAFLINSYNAWTVDLILTKYPDLKSIKDLGSLFSSPWKKKFIPLFGEKLSLDDIEHGYIRGPKGYKEPRIHFAVNCASIGCPALRAEAYRAGSLDSQLEDAATLFLGDRTRNRFKNGVLEISKIFKWYGDDFGLGWRGLGSLREFLAFYASSFGLSDEEKRQLLAGNIDIRFLDYDWSLNSTVRE